MKLKLMLTFYTARVSGAIAPEPRILAVNGVMDKRTIEHTSPIINIDFLHFLEQDKPTN